MESEINNNVQDNIQNNSINFTDGSNIFGDLNKLKNLVLGSLDNWLVKNYSKVNYDVFGDSQCNHILTDFNTNNDSNNLSNTKYNELSTQETCSTTSTSNIFSATSKVCLKNNEDKLNHLPIDKGNNETFKKIHLNGCDQVSHIKKSDMINQSENHDLISSLVGGREDNSSRKFSIDCIYEASNFDNTASKTLSSHTLGFIEKSHLHISVDEIRNVGKVIASEITLIDFKMKAAGFCLKDVRIPLKQLSKQKITIKFIVQKIMDKNVIEVGDKFSISHYVCEIPFNASNITKSNISSKWISLLEEDEVNHLKNRYDLFPEAIFYMQSNNLGSSKAFTAKIRLSLRIILNGMINYQPSKSLKEKRIYVGLFNDEIDLRVSNILNNCSSLSENFEIKKFLSQGTYRINGIICQLFVNPTDQELYVSENGITQPFKDYIMRAINLICLFSISIYKINSVSFQNCYF